MQGEDGGASRRLAALLDAIAARSASRSVDSVHELAQRRADIEAAARLLLTEYGEDALARALLLEQRAGTAFARSVRKAVEQVSGN